MRNLILFIALILVSSCGTKNESATTENKDTLQPKESKVAVIDTTPRVTGIGGIFFKVDNPDSTNAWYGKNLGLKIDDYGSPFEFRNANNPAQINYLRWSTFGKKTKYFLPSSNDYMINYRVCNIEGLIRKFKANGVTILDSLDVYDYGKFIHIMDNAGNKIELWEPVDSIFTAKGTPTTK